MVHQWVTQGMKRSIDNAQSPARGSMMRPTINEESDCLRKICVVELTASYIRKLPIIRRRRGDYLINIHRDEVEVNYSPIITELGANNCFSIFTQLFCVFSLISLSVISTKRLVAIL